MMTPRRRLGNPRRPPVKPIPGPAPDTAKALPRLNRQWEVLNIPSSKSWGRPVWLCKKKALQQIAENPLMGKFGGHVLTEDTGKFAKGHAGRYAHNAFSAWVSYGLAGFLMYVSLTLFCFLIPRSPSHIKNNRIFPCGLLHLC